MDTPGLLRPRYLLQQAMLEDAEAAISGADTLLYVADAGYPASLEHARDFARPQDRPAILCLNKADRVAWVVAVAVLISLMYLKNFLATLWAAVAGASKARVAALSAALIFVLILR